MGKFESIYNTKIDDFLISLFLLSYKFEIEGDLKQVKDSINYIETTPLSLILPQINIENNSIRKNHRQQKRGTFNQIQFLDMIHRITRFTRWLELYNHNETIGTISRLVYSRPDFLGLEESRMFLASLFSDAGEFLCDTCQLKTALGQAGKALFMVKHLN